MSINRGILTGYNDAFIIDEATKNSLIESDPKSAELIRPILRGKDIKRYTYNFANLYLICTFPSKHYDIDNYPAIRDYLLSFDKRRLAQTGEKDIDGIKGFNARKKTGNKWFETQDQINYSDDFNKQKIIYPETTQGAYFIVDNNKYVADKTCFILTGNNLYYLVAILSSTLYEYSYKKIFSSVELGTSGYQYNKHALVKLPVILPKRIDKIYVDEIEKLASDILNNNFNESTYKKIDRLVFDLYSISDDEIEYLRQNSSN